MFNPGWIFVIASIIAVFGIVYSFKKLMSNIDTKLIKGDEVNTQALQKENNRFFIRVVLVEAIPIIFAVIGFILIAPLEGALEMVEILPTLVLVFLILAVGIINIFMRIRETLAIGNISKEAKAAILTMTMIGVSLISAIPIVSIVAILIMLA